MRYHVPRSINTLTERIHLFHMNRNFKYCTIDAKLSWRRPIVAILGKGVRCQWGQFGMRASPYAPPNIDWCKVIKFTVKNHPCLYPINVSKLLKFCGTSSANLSTFSFKILNAVCTPNWWYSGSGESGQTTFTYFCGWKFERSRIELKISIWGLSNTGVDGTASRNLVFGDK